MIAVRALLALVAVAVLAAACGSGGHKVYVQGAYKPKQVVLGAGTPIKDVRWLSYGGSTARAEGMLVLAVNCKPNCATGQTAMEPISFTVSYVGPCKGRRSYRLISIPIRRIRAQAPMRCGRRSGRRARRPVSRYGARTICATGASRCCIDRGGAGPRSPAL
jgi:hypothetical protein